MRVRRPPARVTATINAILRHNEVILEQFLQRIRDCDASHPGCHLSNIASTDLSMVEMEEPLSDITPPFQFRATRGEHY